MNKPNNKSDVDGKKKIIIIKKRENIGKRLEKWKRLQSCSPGGMAIDCHAENDKKSNFIPFASAKFN